jgi:hypothetical protein
MTEESASPTNTSNPDDERSAAGDPTRPARREVLKGAATLATAMALGGEASAQDLNNAPPSASDGRVTVTLQQMDISVQPVGKPFDVTLSIRRDWSGNVEIDIPTIEQVFNSSKDSPNFARTDFPTLIPTPPAGDKPSPVPYPKLPDNYPLGGFIDTVDNPIPAKFRPASGVPIKFVVKSKSSHPEVRYLGLIDHQGRLQFSALDDYPLEIGQFATAPARVTYRIGKIPEVDIRNIQISSGPSNAEKWNPSDFPNDPRGIHFDFGDYDDAQKGFSNEIYHALWADNSATLPYNSNDQAYKSYALAKISVRDFGKTVEKLSLLNLSREPGGEELDPNVTYAEGGLAIDPTNRMNLAAVYQQRKTIKTVTGFVLSRSFNGGETWTRKRIGLASPDDPNKPLDPNIPLGSSDIHLAFDRFGGLWISYLHGQQASTPAGFEGGPVPLVYSEDKGNTFRHVVSQRALTQDEIPSDLWPFSVGLDYTYLTIGPDATDPRYDTVWMSIGDALDGYAPNEYQQRIWGLRVKGLGVPNIDLASLKKYVVPASHQAGFSAMDVGPNGEVVAALRQTNVKGTFLEQIQNNNRLWINVLEHGLADDAFSEKREFALTALGSGVNFPPTPHNNYLSTGTSMIAIDKSHRHRGRIYAVYCNRPGVYSHATKPYLTWSDDKGLTWSNPIMVSTDNSASTATRANIAVDAETGVVAVSWFDARNSPDNTEVDRYATFLDPRELT